MKPGTYHSQSFVPMNAAKPFSKPRLAVLWAASLSFLAIGPAQADTTVPGGIMRFSIAAGTGTGGRVVSVFSVPISNESTAGGQLSGRIASVTASTITVTNAGWTAGQLSVAASPHFIRITSGNAAGRSFLISTITANTSTTLTIDADENVDLTTLGIVTGASGDIFKIFSTRTIGNTFPAHPMILGADDLNNADQLQLNVLGTWHTYYYSTTLNHWTESVSGLPDATNVPIRPDAGILYNRLGASALTISTTGVVPSTDRRLAVAEAGVTYAATGWPIDLTLATSGINLMPTWRTSSTAANSDTVMMMVQGSWRTYFYDGTNWRRQTLGSPISDNQTIAAASGMVITRAAGSGTSVLFQPQPYALASPQVDAAPQVSYDAGTNAYTLTWLGQAGYTYFIQQSTDLRGRWHYLPVIKSGTGGTLQHTGTLPASSTYWRLQFTNTATADPATADFDGDGVNNTAELAADTDPLDPNNGKPGWWATRGVLTSGATANDYAAVNLGQVKQIASMARNELQAKLSGGAGTAINTLVDSWSQAPAQGVVRNDFAAVNIGQLKNVAKPFYDRLAAANYHGVPLLSGQTYPWTATTSDDNDYAAANIGQVKFLFSFDIPFVYDPTDLTDTDNDGLPDGWEIFYFGNLAQGAADDFDNDGVSNLMEYMLGRNPTKPAVTNDPTGAVDLRVYRPM